MVNTIKLPVGIDSFEKIRKYDFYYLDKTKLIEQILKNWSEVSLFTRPRRFGKTLLMDMFADFLRLNVENPEDTSFQQKLFKDTAIMGNREFTDRYMGPFPVIFISLKDIYGATF